jgi:catechol 2,3-dioxygenase-like lactoylglutathione lyase family enzyme
MYTTGSTNIVYAYAYIFAGTGGLMGSDSFAVFKAHVAVHVTNLQSSIEFYRKLFGIEPSKVRKGYAKFDVSNPPLNFALNEGVAGEPGTLSHLGIQVGSTTDVMSIRQKWQERGLVTRDEMHTECCFALQDKSWVRDPDGNEWEVFAVLEPNLPEKPAASVTKTCCASDCCTPAA